MRQPSVILEPDFSYGFGKPPEFEIRYLHVRDDSVYVLGVAASDIRVGERFRSVYYYAPGSLDDRESLAELNLRVQSITAYHNQLNRALTGMTAALLLTGDAAPLVAAVEVASWVRAGDTYHQWADSITAMKKLTLAR